MGRIILLDELTANKIAAGEVVERPASVVKELIENSIDAGSTKIEISVIDGGLSEIVITDNGMGMDADDARMAFERHATSKIRGAADLDVINSLGFRGEALPSIAAVSRITLKTRVAENLSGTKVVLEGGHFGEMSETGCRVGTVIRVNNLFYNTPARQKHMKKPSVEVGHISDVVNKFAMGYPNISFQLVSNGRQLLKTSGRGDLLESIVNVLGLDTGREMLNLEKTDAHVFLTGYLGKPSQSRANRNHQIIYLNGRYIRSRIISEAIEKAYHSMLMTGRYPVFILKLTIEPNQVDVNVHPAKTEVRLANSAFLAEFITTAAAEVLAEKRLIPGEASRAGHAFEDKQGKLVQVEWKLQSRSTPVKPPDIFEVSTGQPEWVDAVREVSAAWPENNSGYDRQDYAEQSQDDSDSGFPMLQPIGQIDCTYIICQGDDGMYMVDQHAAHERILYDKYMQQPEQFTAVAQLLFPLTIQLTHHEIQLFNEQQELFASLGFVVEDFGGNTLLVRGLPASVSSDGGKEIFLDLLDYFSQNRYTISGKALSEKFLITMSCKNAVKAHDRLSLPEMEELLEQLAGTTHPYTCPHGRPTMVYFSGYDLEKKFKRVV